MQEIFISAAVFCGELRKNYGEITELLPWINELLQKTYIILRQKICTESRNCKAHRRFSDVAGFVCRAHDKAVGAFCKCFCVVVEVAVFAQALP